jgi:cytidylate kinase
MNTQAGLESCLSFINSQMHSTTPFFRADETVPKCAITISRESGCGAHAFAEALVRRLNPHCPPGLPQWTLFDRNLVEKVLEDHQLPERLANYMPEDRVLEIDDIMDELFGLHPPSSTLVEKTAETILHLADMGNAIILGRGANVITAKLPHVLHLRMIGSLERRTDNMQRFEGLRIKDAIERIRREDLGRERYVRKHFNKDINDPLLYHLVINTDLVSLAEAVELVTQLVLKRHPHLAAA